MLRIKEISIFIILLSFMNISDIYSAGKSTEVKKEELSPERKAQIQEANILIWDGIKDNKIGEVEEALAKGADVNYRDGSAIPLISALELGRIDIAKLLLKHNADVNIKDKFGYTPLMAASGLDNIEIVKSLLEKGADVNAKNGKDKTALMHASGPGIVKLLLEKEANVNIQDKWGNTALMNIVVAHDKDQHAQKDIPQIVEMLLKNGVDVNAKNKAGDTALILSALISKPSAAGVVEILLNNGADDTIKNKEGKSFLDFIHDKPALQKVLNEYKKRVQKEILETQLFPPGLEGIIAEYVGSYPEKKPAEKV